ncbi:SDR family NAD(P)-dependent oxidoreductase [Rhabdothermincola salaria]|uniref:SDR family NAD(P)-dependent oxidoreductase n=1 Tax=Rhabdothermincola salaria TaxID=2903142 RepID=UPI001E3B42C9|nr:SDR family NAD(P)-dependent oxidoreductase [Rhabdothermincola salaria]MCD9623671.1 SDR family oxidoreductase [Rhabdothermincola salaria]
MSERPVALVTGASRGIGKAAALALAEAGFDVALTARTVREGEGRSEPNSVRGDEPVVALPGSLETTAAEVERRGRRAVSIPMDLLDLASVEAVPAAVLEGFGRIDVLFNNAIYQAGGTMDRLLDLQMSDLDNLMRGNFAHQIRLIQLVVPHMVDHGEGRIINMVSGSARHDPPGPAGDGGWGIAYAASKAAFGRVAGGIEAEYRDRGVRAFNVDPGNVVTEKRKALRPDDDFEQGFGSAPAEATGAVVAWLATDPEATRFVGKWIFAPKLCADLGLLPDWPAGEGEG